MARLSVPRLGLERHVLAGAHGRSLAFGPGHLDGTPLPGDLLPLRRPAGRRPAALRGDHFIVGMTNSGPTPLPDSQRWVTAFCLV